MLVFLQVSTSNFFYSSSEFFLIKQVERQKNLPLFLLYKKIRVSDISETLMNGGEDGIRTHGWLFAITRFPIFLDTVTIAKINAKCLKIIIDKNGLNSHKYGFEPFLCLNMLSEKIFKNFRKRLILRKFLGTFWEQITIYH